MGICLVAFDVILTAIFKRCVNGLSSAIFQSKVENGAICDN